MAGRRRSEAAEAADGGGSVTKPESAHSGRLLLRMPQSLHATLARAADADGVSLNQFINSALASAVSWRGADGPPSSGDKTSQHADVDAISADPPRRGRSIVLTINLVVLLVLAILAIVLLLTAWHQA
jgi:HicB family